MTYQALVKALEAGQIEDAGEEARQLLCRLGHISSIEAALNREKDWQIPGLEEALARRLEREPLDYILQSRFFWRQEYIVSPDCLIPRSDTEILVEQALAILPASGKALFADLCTGSGCVALSILCERPGLSAIGLELMPKTLEVAMKNAASFGKDVADRFEGVLGDALTPDALTVALGGRSLTAIVSNPPYIPTEVIRTLSPEVRHEPVCALDGGPDGLDFYRAILTWAPGVLAPGGSILFEIGWDQGQALRDLGTTAGYAVRIVQDLGGRDRVAILRSGE